MTSTITPGICASFINEMAQGIHVFPTDTLKLALYQSTATLSPDTTAYTSTGEVSGTGYTAGGMAIAFATGFPKLNTTAQGNVPAGRMVLFDFDDTTFSLISATNILGAMIYNSSKANRAVCILNFGLALNPAGEDLTIQWPTPDPANAIIRSYNGIVV